jgi:branched-chain amino acid transport system permease protein
VILVCFIALLVAFGAFGGNSDLARANAVWFAILGAVSLNLLTGFAGQVSLGSAAFIAIGAYTGAVLDRSLHLNMLLALPAAAIAAGITGVLVGIPSLRFKGFYLSLTTLALHFIVIFGVTKYQTAVGGLEGFSLPTQILGPLQMSGERPWYFLIGAITVLIVISANNLTRTKVGRAWVAIRDRDIAASIIGVDVARYRLLAFAFTSAIFGIVGCLQAFYLGNVAADGFTLDLAISFIAMIIIGGMGSTAGSILGAILVSQLSYVIQAIADQLQTIDPNLGNLSLGLFSLQSAAFGLVIMVFLIFEPKGLIAIWGRLHQRWRLWPYSRAGSTTTGARR